MSRSAGRNCLISRSSARRADVTRRSRNSLVAERAELLAKRDNLQSELAMATARLAARRRRKPRAEPA